MVYLESAGEAPEKTGLWPDGKSIWSRFMIIHVVYEDDRHDYVPALRLDGLIAEGKVKKFYRHSEGWVTIGKDPIRGMGGLRYNGPERRKSTVVK